MKILHVSTYDLQGGAARAAYRLHKALLNQGLDSQMLVQQKMSDDFTVNGPKSKIDKALGKLRPILDSFPNNYYANRSSTLFSSSWVSNLNVIDTINKINPDIVHLHWITGGMFSVEDISKIKYPIVWSLHDNWAFTGGCHIMWECDRFKQSCGLCPRLGSKSKNDLSNWNLNRKKKFFKNISNIKIVGLSNWLVKCALDSSLFKNREVICLPNPIDCNVFSPFDKLSARKLLGLPIERKLIIFGAVSATSDVNKGFKELFFALETLELLNTELVIFGSNRPLSEPDFKQKTHYLGHLSDDVSLRLLYNSADVVVVPSLQENLSNVIMESLSCGSPVVAFNVGGNSDLISHKENGYLAKTNDVSDLANGLSWVLNHDSIDKLSSNAREKVLNEFEVNIVSNKYIKLYNSFFA
jgi:glycosyltransferase involved in cell wall biosynthesis